MVRYATAMGYIMIQNDIWIFGMMYDFMILYVFIFRIL
jgi:hypothetical protein